MADLHLRGARIALEPLHQGRATSLVDAASDGELWRLPTTVVPSPETVRAYIAAAEEGRRQGTMITFVTKLLDGDRVIGSTRFWKIDRPNRRLEIGSTWIARTWQLVREHRGQIPHVALRVRGV